RVKNLSTRKAGSRSARWKPKSASVPWSTSNRSSRLSRWRTEHLARTAATFCARPTKSRRLRPLPSPAPAPPRQASPRNRPARTWSGITNRVPPATLRRPGRQTAKDLSVRRILARQRSDIGQLEFTEFESRRDRTSHKRKIIPRHRMRRGPRHVFRSEPASGRHHDLRKVAACLGRAAQARREQHCLRIEHVKV